mmetsp:Transcript_3084/g.8969  ORF Transcript_3084/g.8969 Transcript_3084/m.8969 type:complete len:259 (+) Transcript_3084:599-1375(+)
MGPLHEGVRRLVRLEQPDGEPMRDGEDDHQEEKGSHHANEAHREHTGPCAAEFSVGGVPLGQVVEGDRAGHEGVHEGEPEVPHHREDPDEVRDAENIQRVGPPDAVLEQERLLHQNRRSNEHVAEVVETRPVVLVAMAQALRDLLRLVVQRFLPAVDPVCQYRVPHDLNEGHAERNPNPELQSRDVASGIVVLYGCAECEQEHGDEETEQLHHVQPEGQAEDRWGGDARQQHRHWREAGLHRIVELQDHGGLLPLHSV